MLKFGSKSDINVSYRCTVRLLEDTEIVECEFQPHHKGKYLLEHVCKQLNLVERDYFGLRYVDYTRQRHWLDPAKTIIKQVKDMDPVLFSFRVKFYPPDPFRLKEEITRYQIYLQLKRDLLHGRLYCTPTEGALLAAYVIQADLGDHDPDEHADNYVSEFRLLLRQTPEIEEKIMEIHRTQLKGHSPAQTETNFLKKACQLDTYGVDPHPVKDHRGNQLYLGINHCGIMTFQGSRKTHHFRWPEVQKINYEGKMFIVHLTYNEKKHTVGFKCPTGAACRHVWRCAIEQMLFFTLPSSSEAPTVVTGGSFFSWGTKFKYTGRVEREILEDAGPARPDEPAVSRGARTSSLRRKASSVPATPSTPVGSDLAEIRYSSLPRSNHSGPLADMRLDGGAGLLCSGDLPLSSPYCPDNTLPLLETVSEDQEIPGRSRGHEIQELINHEAAQQAKEELEKVDSESSDAQEVTRVKGTTRADGKVVEDAPKTPDVTDGTPELTSSDSRGKEVDSGRGFDDYYFRDSFEHSSSESQLAELGGGAKAKAAAAAAAAVVPLRTTPVGRAPSRPPPGSPPGPGPHRRFNLLQVFVPSFALVAVSLALATVLVLESDCDALGSVRAWPEMVALRRDYYEPAKEFVRRRLSRLLS
ncbi:FERM domain-containing protein 5 isoform X2 [Bacillus rossius redtenbacheri]|uniref:FERM domain-containing protein 5 isoform X2 n=1 Tax=Bacillus rossius redtenbacheri TaxID=93214 RepID=UPI002FDD694C